MLDIVERFIAVRKSTGLSQTEFGARVGVGIGVIKNIENRKVPPKDLFLKTVCKEYHIDYIWLTTGKGEMFLNDTEMIFDELSEDYKLDELDRKIIETYLKLDHSKRMVLKEFLKEIFEKG